MSDVVGYDIDNQPLHSGDKVVVVYVFNACNADLIGSYFTVDCAHDNERVLLKEEYINNAPVQYLGRPAKVSIIYGKQIRLKKPPEVDSEIIENEREVCLS